MTKPMDHDDPALREKVRAELLYPARDPATGELIVYGLPAFQGTGSMTERELGWREHDIVGPDGLIEHVVWRENPDGTWTPFSQCPKCGDVNACVCDRSAPPEQAELLPLGRRERAA